MQSSDPLTLIKKLLKKKEEGFSLIELVVVVAVLSALSAIAIPQFNCIQRKAKASTALAAMRQIQTECAVNTASTGSSSTFSTGNLNSYQIQSNGSNSCNGAQNTGVISAIPNNTSQLPTFLLATNNNELTYSFRGQTGTNFTDCLGLLCQVFNGNQTRSLVESQDFVLEDSYLERGCSAYAVVEGPSWDESESKAKALGGHLVTLNDIEESSWLAENIKWVEPENSSSGAFGLNQEIAYWIGLTDSTNEGTLTWADGSEVTYSGQGESDEYGTEDYFTLVNNGDLNDLTQNPGDWSMGHWQMRYGIAEISICN